jgi:anti-sigma factor RsiW
VNCDVTYDELAAYVASDLPADRAEAIQRHLSECGMCQGRLSALRRTDSAMDVWSQLPVPHEAVAAAKKALARELRGGAHVMTLEEVADFLRISDQELAEIADELPAFELAGQVRVRREKLLEWIERRERMYLRQNVQSRTSRLLRGV